MPGRSVQRRRKSQSAAIYMPIAVLLVIFIGVFGTSVFLSVTKIEVSGESRYSAEEIIKKSGISVGDNLLFVDINNADIKIRADMPYISKIKIQRRWPDTVVIEITESMASAVINAQGVDWIIDADGRILEMTTNAGNRLIRVLGISPVEPKVGERLSPGENSEARLEYMTSVIKALQDASLENSVTNLDVSNIANITFKYDGRLTIALGMADDIRYKLGMMTEFISKRPDISNAVGTIDMTGELFIFIPE